MKNSNIFLQKNVIEINSVREGDKNDIFAHVCENNTEKNEKTAGQIILWR